jgi:hypothetical protein
MNPWVDATPLLPGTKADNAPWPQGFLGAEDANNISARIRELWAAVRGIDPGGGSLSLGTPNGLSVATGNILSLALATSTAAGALSAPDKVKLLSLQFVSVTDPAFNAGVGGDDVAKIQAALDYALAHGINVVHFPKPSAGFYTIDCHNWTDDRWLVKVYSGLRLVGDGLNATIIKIINSSNANDAFGVRVFQYDAGSQDIAFIGLTFQGENNPFTYVFNNAQTCIYGLGVGSKDVVVRDCHFRDLFGFSVHSEAHLRTHVLDCTFVRCANGVNVNGDWIVLSRNAFEQSEGFECSGKHIVIQSNTFKQALGNACSVGGNMTPGTQYPGAVVVGNTVDGSTSVGMTATNGCVGAVFANNVIRGCEDGGFVAATNDDTLFVLKNNIFASNIIDSNCRSVSPSSIVGCDIRGGQGGWLIYANEFIDRAVTGYDQRIAFHLDVPDCVVSGNRFSGTFKDASFDVHALNTTEELNTFVNKNEEWYGSRAPKRQGFNDVTVPVFINRIWNSSSGDQYAMFAMFPNGALEWGPDTVAGVATRDLRLRRSGAKAAKLEAHTGGAFGTWTDPASLTAGQFIGALTGNADTATKLATPRNIAGLAFDGSANISPTTANVPDSANKRYVTDAQLVVLGNTAGINTGDQSSVSGNAGSATVLQTARAIDGVAFDGSADIRTGWSLDKKPVSPNASDDEFESGALTAWTTGGSQQATAIDPYATFTTATQWRYSHTLRPSWLMIQPTADATYIVPIHKSVTVGTNFMVWARLSFNSRSSATVSNNDHGIGIGLSATSAGAPDFNNFVLLFLSEPNANDKAIRWSSTAASVAATTGSLSVSTTLNVDTQYVLIQKIGSTIHYWCAGPSGSWLYLGSHTNAATFDRVFLRVANAATTAPGNMILGIDFIRFYSGADKLP